MNLASESEWLAPPILRAVGKELFDTGLTSRHVLEGEGDIVHILQSVN